jgi:hypothetical protein
VGEPIVAGADRGCPASVRCQEQQIAGGDATSELEHRVAC